MTFVPLATAREQIADYLSALIYVYIIIVIAYILMQLYLQFGGRVPYSRWTRAVMDFLSQTVEPFLAMFRRFIPMAGPIDLSPMVGLLVLQIGGRVLVRVIQG